MQLTVVKSFRFEAAHRLPWHAGKCSRPHGHGYRLEVAYRGPLQANGIVMDFEDLSTHVREKVIAAYDHQDLNEIVENPTAERLVLDIIERLMAAGVQPSWVRLWETETCSVLVEIPSEA